MASQAREEEFQSARELHEVQEELSEQLRQFWRQGWQALGLPWQKKAGSTVQFEEQPSPLAVPLSSQPSLPTTTPSPQTSKQELFAVSRNPERQPVHSSWLELTAHVSQLLIEEQSGTHELLEVLSKNPT